MEKLYILYKKGNGVMSDKEKLKLIKTVTMNPEKQNNFQRIIYTIKHSCFVNNN